MSGARRAAPSRRGKGGAFGPPEIGTLLTFVGTRWRLWREATEEKDAEVAHNDAAESYTCACWGPFGADQDGEVDHRFALGCASGRVQIWDSRTGEALGPTADAFAAVVRGADCAAAAVALARAGRGSVFVSCFAVPQILEVGVTDGVARATLKAGKVGVVQLSCGGSGRDDWLLSACPSSALKVWHAGAAGQAPQPRAKLAGPADASTCLGVRHSGGRLLALCADGSSQVDVFSVDASAPPAAGKQPPSAAAFVLSAHEPVRAAQFTKLRTTEGRVCVIGCGQTAAMCWSFRPDRAGRGAGPRNVVAAFVVLASDLGGRLLAVRPAVQDTGAPASIVAAFGSSAAPAFASARASPAGGGAALAEPLQGSVASGAGISKRAAAATPVATVAAAAAAQKQEVRQPPKVLGVLEAAVPRQQPRRRALAEVDGAAAEDADASAKKRAKLLPEVAKASAGLSIAPVVRQGLRAKDRASLDSVFNQYGDKKVIDCTVSELTGSEAFDLMQECTTRLLTDPARGSLLCVWIQRALLRHCAFIFSQPAMHRALQPLHDAFQARCSSHRTLLRLRGRLQALRSCGTLTVERSKQATSAAEASASAPLLEYVEGDEDEAEEDAGEDGSMVDGGSCEGASDDDDFGDDSDDDDDILMD